MKILFKPLLIVLLFQFVFSGINSRQSTVNDNPPQYLTLLFLGDVMQHMPQIEGAWDDSLKSYSYQYCFSQVAPIISKADICMANLETTLAGSPYSGYPQFSAPDELVDGLQNAGVDILGTANNHCCDKGLAGIVRTVKILNEKKIGHTGTFSDSLERSANYPLIVHKNGFKIAFLNYTYGTNGIPVPAPAFVNIIDTTIIKKDLKRAVDSLPDKIVIFIHWGEEYQRKPNQFQLDIAKLCLKNGADIIIGMHPHVIQKIEKFSFPDSNSKQVLVAYSLGNYVSNQRDRYKDGGLMVQVLLKKQYNKTEIMNAGYHLCWVNTPLVNGRKKHQVLPVASYEVNSSWLDTLSFVKMMQFAGDSRELLNRENVNVNEIK